jgi:hypothetical protein
MMNRNIFSRKFGQYPYIFPPDLDILGPNVKCRCRNGWWKCLENWLKGFGRRSGKIHYSDKKHYQMISLSPDKSRSSREIVIVGRIPDRYVYSSGMLSPDGYKQVPNGVGNYYYWT